jgi:hypothetical protein
MRARVRRLLGAGLTGTLFVLMLAFSAGAVSADGNFVTVVPGQDPNAPIQYVASPGFVQNGSAVLPGTVLGNGQTVYIVNGQYYYANGTLVSGGYYGPGGFYGPGFIYNGNVGNCGLAFCGYTSAGPIVGFDAHGNPIVYDASGSGTFDTYTTGPNGGICEADSAGKCQKGTPGNP